MTPRLLRPRPPETHGFKTAVIAISLLGCALFATFGPGWKEVPAKKPTARRAAPADAAQFVEIDLRGPYFDRGQRAGYEEGLQNGRKGSSRVSKQVLQFQAKEKAMSSDAQTDNERLDFQDGFESAYEPGWITAQTDKTPVTAP